MASALDLVTLQELKAYYPAQGNSKDSQLALFVTVASRQIEAELDRRLVYRAPPEVEGSANIVAPTILANGALVVAAQPGSAGRTLLYTFTDADRSVTACTVTATGTVGGAAGVTESIDIANGLVQHGLKPFTGNLALTVDNLAGGTAADTIQVGSSLGYVEYHTPRTNDFGELLPLEWPVRYVLEVNEDASRAYGSSTALAAATNYQIVTGGPDAGDASRIIRLYSSLPGAWTGGWRAGKLVYSAGFTLATVPEDIKDICKRLASTLHEENSKGRLGLSAGGNSLTGQWTRYGPSKLTKEMREQIAHYRRRRFLAETGERDFDLEAA